jgi:hypothetical protein
MKSLKIWWNCISVLFLACIILLLGLITGCNKYTPQVAEEQVTKAYIKYTPMVAGKTRVWFPCINTKDTVTTIDSAAYEVWKNSTDSITKSYEDFLNALTPEVIIDSANCIEKEAALQRNTIVYKKQLDAKNEQIKLLNIAISNNKPIIKTVTLPAVKDSAEIYLLNNALLQSVNETAKEKEKVEALEEKVAKKNKYLLYFLIALLVSLGVNCLQFRKKTIG